ncbi:hypothetical protein [Streptomyces sp. NPDC047043]|uniref:hypothetical protein n=1 Tax=Streptomyces sp. NPDC047043 TaxID=3154497 RepID=UPI0033C22C23
MVGDYHLYVVDAQGNASAASKALVRQRWNHVDDKAAGVTYSGTWSNWNDTKDMNGSEKVTSTAGNYAEFSFTGSGVRYLSMTQPNMGDGSEHGGADPADGVFRLVRACGR